MENKYLVINGGSSSLKFSIYNESNETIISGVIEKIGSKDSCIVFKKDGNKEIKNAIVANHTEALSLLINELLNRDIISNIDEIKGIGHRVLHGAEFYSDSVIINDEVINNIESIINLGPLHLPGEVACIKSCQQMLPDVKQVAVFDTAFHQTMPKENYIYPVPMSWYQENKVRKYGFHGTSHKYITQTKQQEENNETINLIICHLGNGSSISAIKDGKCLDTTMGLTPLDGIIMGTRSGSIDPSIIEYIAKEKNLTIEQVTNILNNESGLTGIFGTNDLRDIEPAAQNGNELANLALNELVNSIVKYIMYYYLELEGQVDSIVLTAGIGENSSYVRDKIMKKISKVLPVEYDAEKNFNLANSLSNKGPITTDSSVIKVEVIPTNEEIMILKDTKRLISENNQALVRK